MDTKTVAKESIEKVYDGQYLVTLRIKVTRDSVEIIDKTVTFDYKTGKTATKMKNEINAKIDQLIKDYDELLNINNIADTFLAANFGG